jgi:hypothetical protein
MLSYQELASNKKTFIFELDEVLYPERDFYLQVYYLFSHFIEYVETVPSATDLLELMKKVYEIHGHEQVFERVQAAFDFDSKYRENFDRLLLSAQLPLKVELYDSMQVLLQDIVNEGKQIFIYVQGHPDGQLNKIRQMEWKGLAKHLKVYFSAEYEDDLSALRFMIDDHEFNSDEVVVIGSQTATLAAELKIDFIHHSRFVRNL